MQPPAHTQTHLREVSVGCVRGAKDKIPYLIIIGHKEKEDRLLSVRKLGDGDMGSFSFEDFMKHLNDN